MRELAKCEVDTISGGLNCSELDDWATEPVERSVVPVPVEHYPEDGSDWWPVWFVRDAEPPQK